MTTCANRGAQGLGIAHIQTACCKSFAVASPEERPVAVEVQRLKLRLATTNPKLEKQVKKEWHGSSEIQLG